MTTEVATTLDCVSPTELRSRGLLKWTAYGEDILPAWVAEMDYPLAPPIQGALMEAVKMGRTGYPQQGAASGLPAACAGWLEQRWGWQVDPARIHALPDILRGIELALHAFSPPETGVVLPTPSYPPFFQVAEVAGHSVVEVPMIDDPAGYRLDVDGVDRALAGGAGTVLLCHPYNPLGHVFSRSELLELTAVVERHRARVISDEVHASLLYPGETFRPYASVSAEASRHTATLTSASKAWNLPGLKCAQIVLSNDADADAWAQLPFVQTHGVSTLGIVANVAAYTRGAEWLDETLHYLDGNRRLLFELLQAKMPAVRYRIPAATYLAWLDCRALGLDNPTTTFLQGGVALSGGAAFGAPGKGFVRLNFATSRPILEEIVDRMAQAVERY